MTKYEQLEQKIEELRAEVERLKKEEDKNKLPKDFRRAPLMRYLKTRHPDDLTRSFLFSSTPEGEDYWFKIVSGRSFLQPYDVVQLQKWVILSYEQEFGE